MTQLAAAPVAHQSDDSAVKATGALARRLLLALLVFAAALLAVGPGAAQTQGGLGAMLQDLERVIGITFPEGTRLVRFEQVTGSDALVRAKLTFTPSQWEEFIRGRFDAAAFEEGQRYLLGTNVDWWNPRDPQHLPTAQVRLPEAKVLDVGVDRSNPEEFLVFLVWHGT